MQPAIQQYQETLSGQEQEICTRLYGIICAQLPAAEVKIWHRHPVWFLEGNPIAGYSKLKSGIRLLFWSGQSFDEPALAAEGSFRAAGITYTDPAAIIKKDLERWLKKSAAIQWDYKNIVKRKGVLERLK